MCERDGLDGLQQARQATTGSTGFDRHSPAKGGNGENDDLNRATASGPAHHHRGQGKCRLFLLFLGKTAGPILGPVTVSTLWHTLSQRLLRMARSCPRSLDASSAEMKCFLLSVVSSVAFSDGSTEILLVRPPCR